MSKQTDMTELFDAVVDCDANPNEENSVRKANQLIKCFQKYGGEETIKTTDAAYLYASKHKEK